MKKIFSLILLLSLVINAEAQQKQYDKPEKVIITGQVLNANQEQVKLEVHRLGLLFNKEVIEKEIDSLGHFSLSFKTFLPTEVSFQYGAIDAFPILTHPKDSIHLTFDAGLQDRGAFLKSIQFSGDSKKTNEDAIKFEQFRHSKPLKLYNGKHLTFAHKHYKLPQYESYLDSLKQELQEQYHAFIKEVKPNEEVSAWAKFGNEDKYYYALTSYIDKHSKYHKSEDLPKSFYDRVQKRFPIRQSMMMNTKDLNYFTNAYLFNYFIPKLFAEGKFQTKSGINLEQIDSIMMYSIVRDVQDPMMKQLLLAEHIVQRLKVLNTSAFEKYRPLLEREVREPYLIKPLIKYYGEVKTRLATCTEDSESLMKVLKKTSLNIVADVIWRNKKGKVIYIDFWHAGCANCRALLADARQLEVKMKGLDVAFVYICLESSQEQWQEVVNKFHLGGMHFLFDYQKTEDLINVFGIKEFPYYLLIDRQGTIIKKGKGLEPNNAERQILDLLQK